MAERKTLQDLTIKDNFLFGAVMMDEEICRELLEFVLGFRIAKVTVSIGVQGAIRSKPCNFSDLLCYPQSAYVQYASIVCLVNHGNSYGWSLRVEKVMISAPFRHLIDAYRTYAE